MSFVTKPVNQLEMQLNIYQYSFKINRSLLCFSYVKNLNHLQKSYEDDIQIKSILKITELNIFGLVNV